MSSLRGRTALVTGAAKRIGRQITLGLAAEGAHCVIHYNRSAADAEALAEECRGLGVRAHAVTADLQDDDSTRALGAKAVELGVDILVHNASTFDRLPFLESSPVEHADMLDRDWAVHVRAPYLLSRIIAARMVENGWGRIVLFGDWSSDAAVYRHYAPYIVSKAAVPTLAKVLALELGSRSPGITVNAVLPGPIIPPEGHDPTDRKLVEQQTVLGSWVGGEEVKRAVLFLVASEKITGCALRVDAGRAIKAL